jgi:hypothetical protein
MWFRYASASGGWHPIAPLIPRWAHEGGIPTLAQSLKDTQLGEGLRREPSR